jgi:hypothetical protein
MTTDCAHAEELRLRVDDLSWRLIESEVVAVDISASTYLSANPSGALLWQMLAEGTTRRALVERLSERFELAADVAAADVDAFLQSLDARGLLQK